jgi:hypothetical protein
MARTGLLIAAGVTGVLALTGVVVAVVAGGNVPPPEPEPTPEPKPKPKPPAPVPPIPDIPDDEPVPIPIVDPNDPNDDPPFVPGAKDCNGIPYNAALYPDPASVMAELRVLGFAAAIPYTNTNLSGTAWKNEVKKFQAVARSRGMPGFENATAADVDGIVGPCTLLALTSARHERKGGTWDVVVA